MENNDKGTRTDLDAGEKSSMGNFVKCFCEVLSDSSIRNVESFSKKFGKLLWEVTRRS